MIGLSMFDAAVFKTRDQINWSDPADAMWMVDAVIHDLGNDASVWFEDMDTGPADEAEAQAAAVAAIPDGEAAVRAAVEVVIRAQAARGDGDAANYLYMPGTTTYPFEDRTTGS